MTPEQAREAAAVMLAWADGKKIQRRLRLAQKEWEKSHSPIWDWQIWEYRVAPEPWTGKIWVHPDGRLVASNASTDHPAMIEMGWRLITVKEVTDE